MPRLSRPCRRCNKRALDYLAELGLELVVLGCRHEEQHQELLLTDVLHLFARTHCSRRPGRLLKRHTSVGIDQLRWIEGRQGPIDIGHDGAGFAYDCEAPRQTVCLAPHALADRLTTNGEWSEFIEDRGYRTASLWLSDGWTWVQGNGIEAPLHWRRDESGEWLDRFGLDGLMPIDPTNPVPTAGSDRFAPCLYQRVDALQNRGKLQPSQGFGLQSGMST